MTHFPLISSAGLAARLDDPRVRIVDIRGHVLPPTDPPPHYFSHHAEYLDAHIPGAVFVDWVHEITDPADPRHAQIAPPERFQAVMQRIGVDDDTYVVVYDDTGGMFATRLWWALRYYGHERVGVLAGGWQGWLAEGRETTSTIEIYPPGDFVARPQAGMRVSADEVLDGIGSLTLLDARSVAEYNGEVARAPRKGHIPTAVSVPRATLQDETGQLLPADQLRARFGELGINGSAQGVVTYCNGGVSATYTLMALEVAGLRGGALYDGSWKEWGSDKTKPIE
jgi:thiosulfate/3-mercaptopyruvate sulfurtransferase